MATVNRPDFIFLDFDHEERPGVDGVKFKYLRGSSSGLESGWSLNGFVRGIRR